MLYIEYISTGIAINDFYLDDELEYVKRKVQNPFGGMLRYSTYNIVARICVAIRNGEIDASKIEIVLDNHLIM